jgi:phosphonatase-like hydrolase
MDEAMKNGEVSEIPGAAQVLADLRATGTTVCLTTGFSPEVQRTIIEHLGWQDLVDFVLAPSETLRGRPYPDMVLTAALRTGIDDVREVAVIGDTANDLWSGRRRLWVFSPAVMAGLSLNEHRIPTSCPPSWISRLSPFSAPAHD